jgi:cytosine/adenosine deaminase-related metal-dependent hydrolase
MVTIGALEAIRTGTTTIVENSGGISRSAAALAKTGLRCVFAESVRDSENVAGPMSPEGLEKSVAPRFSPRLRDEGMQRINDLFTAWHGKNQGRISVFPAAALAETASPELLQAVRAFADKHDLGYTIHLSQSRAEVDFMVRRHGVRPPAFRQTRFSGPGCSPHCRYGQGDIAVRRSAHHHAPGGDGREPRRHSFIAALRRPAARSPAAPTTAPAACSG